MFKINILFKNKEIKISQIKSIEQSIKYFIFKYFKNV